MRGIFWLVVLLGVDQIVKFFMIKFANHLVTKNPGFVFGFVAGFPGLLMAAIILILIFVVYANRFSSFFSANRGSFYLLLAGGISNLLDRFWRGYVVDYIHIRSWPAFNLADIMIILAGVIIIINMFGLNPLRRRR